MGHLLSTVNPEAAQAIQPETEPFPIREPYIGEPVQYFARPGEGRAGKMVFPAVIHHWHEDGRAELTVIYAADDLRDYANVQKKTHDRPWNAWDFCPPVLEAAAGQRMLANDLYGDRAPDEKSVYEMLKSLDLRLQKLEAIQAAIKEARRHGVLTRRAHEAAAKMEKEEAEEGPLPMDTDSLEKPTDG